jgi:hypothetical protein
MKYELDSLDWKLFEKCVEAVEYDDNGAPIKDVLDPDDIVEAIRLLVTIITTEENTTK